MTSTAAEPTTAPPPPLSAERAELLETLAKHRWLFRFTAAGPHRRAGARDTHRQRPVRSAA